LEKELNLFPNSKVFMLMGDVAIKSINAIARRVGEKAAIPAGSTYKIRGQEYTWHHRRLFPSYRKQVPASLSKKANAK
jgi:uracil-DNA glycosylase